MPVCFQILENTKTLHFMQVQDVYTSKPPDLFRPQKIILKTNTRWRTSLKMSLYWKKIKGKFVFPVY